MKMPRMWDWTVVAAVAVLIVATVSPHQLGIVAYKFALLSLAAVGGYWLDRSLFPYARPHQGFCKGHHHIGVGLMLRRAVIVAAAMLAVGLGL